MKQIVSSVKRILALLLVLGMVAGTVPADLLEGLGPMIVHALEPSYGPELSNGYIKVGLLP